MSIRIVIVELAGKFADYLMVGTSLTSSWKRYYLVTFSCSCCSMRPRARKRLPCVDERLLAPTSTTIEGGLDLGREPLRISPQRGQHRLSNPWLSRRT